MTVEWIDGGREAQNPPNPDYPAGLDLDLSKGAKAACFISLPYPAKRCGYYLVTCDLCGLKSIVSTAGRADDPRSVRVACKGH